MNRSTLSCLALAAIIASVPARVAAQAKPADYPNRVVRIVLPQPAGGGTDTVARTVAGKLSEAWGQQVIVDNRPGPTASSGPKPCSSRSPTATRISTASLRC